MAIHGFSCFSRSACSPDHAPVTLWRTKVSRHGVRILLLAVCLLIAASPVPIRAQGPGGGPPMGAGATIQSLSAELAALTARVAKLEGNITAADLAGTYTTFSFQNELHAGFPARIGSHVRKGTVTLAADGTAMGSDTEKGSILTQGSPWFITPVDSSGSGTATWTYDNGVVTIVEDNLQLSVAAGGRVLVGVNEGGGGGQAPDLTIWTRLN